MSQSLLSTTVQILGKPYTVRCPEEEAPGLVAAAALVDQRMLEVQASGKAINLERIAIITALNIAFEFLQTNEQKTAAMQKINDRLSQLQDKIDLTMKATPTTSEFVYSFE